MIVRHAVSELPRYYGMPWMKGGSRHVTVHCNCCVLRALTSEMRTWITNEVNHRGIQPCWP